MMDASYDRRGGGSNGLQPGYRIEPLNRLAFPKGKIPKCEISGQAASVACITPHITLYYATEEQAEQAWHGKHAQVLLVSLIPDHVAESLFWLGGGEDAPDNTRRIVGILSIIEDGVDAHTPNLLPP